MKKDEYSMQYKEMASPEDDSILAEGMFAEAESAKGMSRVTPFAFLIKDEKGTVLAGVKGSSYYGCLTIDIFWVDPAFRQREWGTQLMHAAEEQGKRRKCTFASIAVMDWEPLDFYKHRGYEIESVREGFDNDSKMYVLRKSLK